MATCVNDTSAQGVHYRDELENLHERIRKAKPSVSTSSFLLSLQHSAHFGCFDCAFRFSGRVLRHDSKCVTLDFARAVNDAANAQVYLFKSPFSEGAKSVSKQRTVVIIVGNYSWHC